VSVYLKSIAANALEYSRGPSLCPLALSIAANAQDSVVNSLF
jgi:hypothetical protein